MKEEMAANDQDGDGCLDKRELKKSLQTMRVNASEDDITQVFSVLGQTKAKSDMPTRSRVNAAETTVVRIKTVVDRASEIGRLPQLPAYVMKSKDDKRAKSMQGGNQGSSQVAAYDAEKKYKKNLEALTSQIEERERRINAQEAEIQIYHKKIKGLERQLETIDHKKADAKVKPPKATENESTIFSLSQ